MWGPNKAKILRRVAQRASKENDDARFFNYRMCCIKKVIISRVEKKVSISFWLLLLLLFNWFNACFPSRGVDEIVDIVLDPKRRSKFHLSLTSTNKGRSCDGTWTYSVLSQTWSKHRGATE
jgi:hypothetical protein